MLPEPSVIVLKFFVGRTERSGQPQAEPTLCAMLAVDAAISSIVRPRSYLLLIGSEVFERGWMGFSSGSKLPRPIAAGRYATDMLWSLMHDRYMAPVTPLCSPNVKWTS